MTTPDPEADWLQDTLANVARKLRQPGVSAVQLEECAAILERIVGDLRGTQPLETVPAFVRNPCTRWWVTVATSLGLYLLLKRLFGRDSDSEC
ncbi:hypothetical protein [Lacipirellula sp.]|uniref:hypothetical protein n=1 Tax=Lacipirellula sp. TaxID=2691419 RepID=UPI003D0FCE54